MTMAELFATLVARDALPARRVKDFKTSLNYLTQALGHPSPDLCPVDPSLRDVETWLARLDAHFAALTAQGRTISGKTRSNTRNNLRGLFRAAADQGLVAAPPPASLLQKPKRRAFEDHLRETMPYQSSYRPTMGPRHFGLPHQEWPPDIQAGWQTYLARCDMSIRQTRLESNVVHLSLYLGYLTRIVGRQPTWEDIFDTGQLRAFVQWHAARLERQPISAAGWQTVIVAATIAKVLGRPDARSLADFRNALPTPEPLHNKRDHWVSLAQLEAVAEAWLQEGRAPDPYEKRSRHRGAIAASRFQKGVILKLLVRVPLRQRNIRELKLDRNLYQDHEKHWHLHFRGTELKIGMRETRVNEYHVDLTDYCPDFIPVLEEFLGTRRPKLPGAAESKFLFLTHLGRPFTSGHLGVELRFAVGTRTGKRFYPHLIRSIWATEYLERTQDFTTASVLLGDTLREVMKTYYDVVNKDHHAKAKAFLTDALRAG
jgi:integrase